MQFFGQIPMWVYDQEALAGSQILRGQGQKQCRFPGAGFADNIKVGKAIGLLDAESTISAVHMREADVCDPGLIGHPARVPLPSAAA
jgi:hypothetical protein